MPKKQRGSRGMVVPQQPPYLIEIMGRKFPVNDPQHASMLVSEIRDRSGAGASEIGAIFPIWENGIVIGYVSYNGKVWKGHPDSWKDAELIYDPHA